MSVIRLSRSHGLNEHAQEVALERLAAQLGNALGAKVERSERVLRFAGTGFSGTVSLNDSRLEGEVHLGILMRPMKRAITREIEAGLSQYLGDT
jgi:putative polyhydroxyalkanoate system protein